VKWPAAAMLGFVSPIWAVPAADLACAGCHRAQVDLYYGRGSAKGNTMARALYRAAESELLRANPVLEFALGRFRYRIDRRGEEPVYTVTDGTATLSARLEYAFGQGAAGQTYAYRHEGRWYESRLSFYNETKALDLTMGAPPGEPRTLVEAAGREMTDKDVVECFGCHTTSSVVGRAGTRTVAFDKLQAGVGCANCHAGSARHAEAFRPGRIQDAAIARLSALSTEEESDFCGRCHRTWADIATNGPRGVGNVRFQPYRLANSRCYDATDRRIACTACHDSHGPLQVRGPSYDARCNACHSGRKNCPKAKQNCVECHMPRYEIPGSHHLFTDHQIRIVRPNEAYPN
jgi:hypothetical protein